MSQYYVDPEDVEEMNRLLDQSYFLMRQFGGILPSIPIFRVFIACSILPVALVNGRLKLQGNIHRLPFAVLI